MKCLSRIEMQEYLDREVTPAMEAEISTHLESCESCIYLYKMTVSDKEAVNRIFDELGSDVEDIEVPEFIQPDEKRNKKIYLRVVEVLAAASLIGFVVLFQPAKKSAFEKIPEAEMMLYEFYDGKDLNKMWHEKSQIIILQDEHGNIIEPILTY